jgi:thiol-disulfide isomerase/thioredoxin
MKVLLLAISLWLTLALNAQTSGTLIAKSTDKTNGEVEYIYTPPTQREMPKKIRALITYHTDSAGDVHEIIPLIKHNALYSFKFKAPKSVNIVLASIIDDYKNVIDNNKGSGYFLRIHQSASNDHARTNANQALLSVSGSYFHRLNVPASTVVRQFEESFALDSSLKKTTTYYYPYLMMLNTVNKDTAGDLLRKYAAVLSQDHQREEQWSQALNIYYTLGSTAEAENLKNKTLVKYPKGETAKQEFWNQIRSAVPTEDSILAAMQEYQVRFNDSSTATKDQFYLYLIPMLSMKEDWTNVLKYGNMVSNKFYLASHYNNIAWQATGGTLEGSGKDLTMPKLLSLQSIGLIEELMNDSISDKDPDALVQEHVGYSDTYALILYQLGNYDSAFYYQNEIAKLGPMGVEGMERYAAYAHKAKGANFTRAFIEPELLKGASSPTMLNQLQQIYKELNLPDKQFQVVKSKASAAAMKKMAEQVVEKFGSQKAPNFSMRDGNGNLVTLASLKGKVVILDFWATWCGPCRGSFPEMQKLVNRYKNYRDVVFLFVNTWEQGDSSTVKTNVLKFIQENKYTFRVLFDFDNKAVATYKVEGVPTKFVINRQGNIISMASGGGSDMSAVVEAARKM